MGGTQAGGTNRGNHADFLLGSASISMKSGNVQIDNGAGASIALVGGLIVIDAGACVLVKSGSIVDIEAAGGLTAKARAALGLNGDGLVNAEAGAVKLDG